MDLNNNKNKRDKQVIILVVLGILLVTGIVLGISYAYWKYSTTQSTTNKLTSDCLEIALEDENDEITLKNNFPIRDEEAEELTPYTFKVTNKCNTSIRFDVNLEVMSTSTSPYGTYGVSGRLNSSYIATSFNGGEKKLLTSAIATDPTYSSYDYTAVEAYKVGSSRLSAKASQTYTFKLWMDESVTALDAMNKVFVSKLSVTASVAPICKRATELHTETCVTDTTNEIACMFDGNAYSSTTFGNLGTSGTLTSGDAFDCDVNGDGIYNAETERFYYVSDYYDTVNSTFDSTYAALIYYNNVNNGVPDNTITYAFDATNVRKGPTTALTHLPTTNQWSGVSLKNTTRNIQTETGSIRVSGFSYEGYAARFLTYQELYNGCYDGSTSITSTGGLSNKCKYLYENTKYSSPNLPYGSWIETGYGNYDGAQWGISGSERSLDSSSINENGAYFGASRPVIDVAKSDIDY